MKESCPGSKEIRSPYPEEIICPYCNNKNEIWSDEPDMLCKECNTKISREMPPSCIQWCPSARECLGVEKYERIMRVRKTKL
ncbi:MAG TPA: phosphohydrolase [Nitrospirae bacterium]|nr:phosphohydrolase [Nitrospirota bacterium]